MVSLANEATSQTSLRLFTKAERIQQLNDIDKNITQLLRSAGLAIKTLTACKSDSTSTAQPGEDDAEDFIEATNIYLRSLHSVDIRLKRQMYGLNEAGISGELSIRSDDQSFDGARVAGDRTNLDVGWLNSRSGKVAKDMEAELWVKARTFLEAIEAKRGFKNGLIVDSQNPSL